MRRAAQVLLLAAAGALVAPAVAEAYCWTGYCESYGYDVGGYVYGYSRTYGYYGDFFLVETSLSDPQWSTVSNSAQGQFEVTAEVSGEAGSSGDYYIEGNHYYWGWDPWEGWHWDGPSSYDVWVSASGPEIWSIGPAGAWEAGSLVNVTVTGQGFLGQAAWACGGADWDNLFVASDGLITGDIQVSPWYNPGVYICVGAAVYTAIAVFQPPQPPPRVQSLQYLSDAEYVDATSSTIYVAVGTTVNFRALPSPPAQEFPSGYPVWSGTSGASGTGATTEVAFNTVSSCASDFKTVSATSDNTLTANVLVFDFDAVLTPDDNFADRSTTDFGVGETIALSFTISPSITAGQAGGLEWHVVSGGGDLTDNDDGTGTYTVPASSGTFALAVQIKQGPSKTKSKQKSPTIVAPTGAYQERATGTGIWHIYGKPSVGHKARTYLTPTNVSFRNIQVREDAAVVEATGIMAGANEAVHPEGSWFSVESCGAAKGCVLESTDTVEIEVDTFGPFYPGDFNLPIPRRYKVVGSGAETPFTVLTHHATVNAAGTTTSTKGGTGFTRAANDPTSSY